MSDALSITVLGTHFAVSWGPRVTKAQREGMLSAWKRCAAPGALAPPPPRLPTESQPFSAAVAYSSKVADGGTLQLQSGTFEGLAEQLTSEITVAAILENAGELTMLHACGLAHPDTGAVVALVAKSGTGKTTASSVLARTYGYVTDETVAIRPDGAVLPFPKPLSVKQKEPGQAKLQVGPDELGLLAAPRNLFVQSIVLLDRVDAGDLPSPVLQQVPLADAVLALIPDSSSQAKIRQPLQSLCRIIDGVGGVWKVTYAEAGDLPRALAPLLRQQGTSAVGWSAPGPGRQSGAIPAGWLRRAEAIDAVEIAGDLLVMLDDQILRLGGIAPAMWEATAQAVPLEMLAEKIGAVHGKPDGYQAAVNAAAEQLVAKSILERGVPMSQEGDAPGPAVGNDQPVDPCMT